MHRYVMACMLIHCPKVGGLKSVSVKVGGPEPLPSWLSMLVVTCYK